MNEFSLWQGTPENIFITYPVYVPKVRPPLWFLCRANVALGISLLFMTQEVLWEVGVTLMMITILLRRNLWGYYVGACPSC